MKRKHFVLLTAVLFCTAVCAARAAATPGTITMEELARLFQNGGKLNLLDVRTPEEYAMFHLSGAVNIDHAQIADRLDELRGKDWIIYCRTSRRAGLAAETLDSNGFKNVRYLDTGMSTVPMFVKKYTADRPELAAAMQAAVDTMYPVAGFRHPPIQLETIAGRGVELISENRGKTIIMLFWRLGVPEDAAFFDKTAAFVKTNKNIVFAPVIAGPADAKVAYDGDVFLDPGNAATNFYGLDKPPMLALVDTRGVLRAVSFSAPDEPLSIYGGKSFAQLAGEAADGTAMTFPDVGIYAEERDPTTLKDKIAADFTLPDETGVSHHLADAIGKPVALVFFSIGCPYSQRELIALNDYQKKHAGEKDVRVLAVTMSGDMDSQSQILSFMAANDIEFPVLYDGTGEVMSAYKVSSVPVWMALDKQGAIGLVTVGYMENTEALLDEAFASMGY
jgi:rhodanese-related sulfurtransferase/peroxiredoxin